MTMRRYLRAFVLAGACFATSSALAGAADRPILLELFTSQGCSDCPPADALLTEFAARKDVVALTFPITYWDMLGWKDTLATEANTNRQKSYAKKMSRTGVYTPQLIVGGTDHLIGSQRDKLAATIASVRTQSESVPVTIVTQPGRVTVTIASHGTDDRRPVATIWVMQVLSQAKIAIGGGENNARELTYTNVVRELQRFGSWDGSEKIFTVPVRAEPARYDSLAVVVQRTDFGPVIGAAVSPVHP